mgnify:CR=1 FL=1
MDIRIKFYSPKETIKKKDFNVRAWLAGNSSTYYEIDIQKDKKNSKSAYLGSIPDDSIDFDVHYWVQERKSGDISNVKKVTITVEDYQNSNDPKNSIWIERVAKPAKIIIDGGSPQPTDKDSK